MQDDDYELMERLVIALEKIAEVLESIKEGDTPRSG